MYQATVKHPDAPGVVLKDDGKFKCVVPIEFCTIYPNQIFKLKVPEEFAPEMVAFASPDPTRRLHTITNAVCDFPALHIAPA